MDFSTLSSQGSNLSYLEFTNSISYVTLAENQGGWNPLNGNYEKGYNWRHPTGPKDNIDNKPDHPVVQITWQDAMAYCNWFDQKFKAELEKYSLTLYLPTEAQWEKAARGEYGNEWPWGNEFDKKKCNTKEGGKGGTTPVDAYPSGASPYGVMDMVGNIWEWMNTLWKEYPYREDNGREHETIIGYRVVRGGSFGTALREARCAYRFYTRHYW